MPERRGMIIKNVSEAPLSLRLDGRTVALEPGDETPVTAVEVRDRVLREALQLRTIAIVRPTTPDESDALDADLDG
ncbi:MAG: hypothetical protein AAGJ11_19390 [Bacteroidota bacterium]